MAADPLGDHLIHHHVFFLFPRCGADSEAGGKLKLLMRFFRSRRELSALVLLLGLWTAPAFGQACAMCYANAKATPKDGQSGRDRALLVLLVPPLGIMSVGVGLAFRYGKRRDREQE